MGRKTVKTRIPLAVLVALLLVTVARAQHEARPSSGSVSKQAVTISGSVSPDGKTFTAENGRDSWIVANPEVLIRNAGHRVRVRAYVDSAARKILVASTEVLLEGARLQDSAFRR